MLRLVPYQFPNTKLEGSSRPPPQHVNIVDQTEVAPMAECVTDGQGTGRRQKLSIIRWIVDAGPGAGYFRSFWVWALEQVTVVYIKQLMALFRAPLFSQILLELLRKELGKLNSNSLVYALLG